MKMRIVGVVAFAVFMLGIGTAPSPALAKCGKDCKTSIASTFKSCKNVCKQQPKSSRKACKGVCKQVKSAAKAKCLAASNPTPPNCSPSGAFLD